MLQRSMSAAAFLLLSIAPASAGSRAAFLGAASSARPFGAAPATWTTPLARLVNLSPKLFPAGLDASAAAPLEGLRQRLQAAPAASAAKVSAAALAPLAAALEAQQVTPLMLEQALEPGQAAGLAPALERAARQAAAQVQERAETIARAALQDSAAPADVDVALRALRTIQRDYLAYFFIPGAEPASGPAAARLSEAIAAVRQKARGLTQRRVAAAGSSLQSSLEGEQPASAVSAAAAPSAPPAALPSALPVSAAAAASVSAPASRSAAARPGAPPQPVAPLPLSLGPQAAAAAPKWSQGVFLPEPVAQPIAEDTLGVTVHRLANGMTVYLSPNRQEPRVYYEVAVRAGSRHDPFEATGMAHYLEHMQFKGTTGLGTLDYAREKLHLDRIEALYDQLFTTQEPAARARILAEIDQESQAAAQFAVPNELDRLLATAGFDDINAHTSKEETIYKGSFPSNRADVWSRIEVERLTNPVYRIFLPELEAVYEEFNRGLDNPNRAIHDAGAAALYKDHPYGRSVIGLGEHLKNPSISRMRAFFRERYRPNNMALILSGDFDRQEMLARVEKTFGALKPAVVPPAPPATLRKIQGVERSEIRFQAEEQLLIGFQVPGKNHPDEDALILMDMMMANGVTGILDLWANKAQRVKESYSYPSIFNEAGGWFMAASPKEGQTLEQAEQVMLEALKKLKAGEFSETDLKAAITEFEVRAKRRLEKNESRVELIRDSFIGAEQWPEAVARLERLKGVTKADVLRVAQRYTGEDRIVVYRRKGNPKIEKVKKPAFTAVPIDTTRQSALFKELASLPAKPTQPRFLKRGRDYRTLDRSWGRLYWTANPVNDLFKLELRFERGGADAKLLPLALDLLSLSGAGDLSIDEFQKALYRLGSAMDVKIDPLSGEREFVVTLTGIEKNLEETLRLAMLRFNAPNIGPTAFAQMIEVERGDRKDRKLNTDKAFGALRDFAAYGKDSPVLQALSPSELDALTEKQLRASLAAVFSRKRAALYTGAASAEQVARSLSAAQGRRRTVAAAPASPAKLQTPSRPRVIFVHREGMNQALLGVYAGDGVYDPSTRVDSRLYNTLMGGNMSGAYFQEVRESRALVYTVAGGYGLAGRASDDSRLWASAGTQTDKALQTFHVLRELMLHAPLTPGRYAAARRQLEEEYRTSVVKLDEIPTALFSWERMGLKGDPRASAFQKLLAYRPEQLAAFASRFTDKTLTFYILADRSSLDLDALKNLGSFEERSVDEIFPF